MPSQSLPRDVESLVHRFCMDVATPRSLTVSLMVRYGEWDQLSDLRCDPGTYVSAQSYYRDVIVTDFLRKLEELPTSVDRRKAAHDTFWECERKCFKSNERLSHYLDRGLIPTDDVVGRIILLAKKKLNNVLGQPPDILDGRFGPGATFGDKGQRTTVPDKMTTRPTLTSECLPWLFQWAGTAWASACASDDRSPEFIHGNRFTTVPKDCTKDRGIAVEPSINGFYQLGFGRVMKSRLRAAGLNLQYAQEVHRRVACEASISGSFATLDLSNASDTVCNNLVKLLLPDKWFSCLSSLRSPKTLVGGHWVVLEKFSSMGNGFTFELETAIFASICSAVMEYKEILPEWGVNLYVYGDDIIVPVDCARDCIAALRFFGFQENSRKTFFEGPFRESCGGDYFDGVDVRPHYLKELPHAPNEWIALANGLYRLGRTDLNGRFSNRYISRVWLSTIDNLPTWIRSCRGPKSLGDLVLHDAESRWNFRWRHSIRYFRVYRPAEFRRVTWDHFLPDVTLASALYGVSDGRPKGRLKDPGGVTPRDAVTGYKLGWVPLS